MEERFEVDRVVPKAKTEPQRVAAGTVARPVYKYVFVGVIAI